MARAHGEFRTRRVDLRPGVRSGGERRTPLPSSSPDPKEANMPQYLMSVWHDEDYVVDFSGDDAQRMVAQVNALNEQLQATNTWVFAGGLHPASSATVVRPKDGQVSMTDGPYAESKEQMGGFWVIEAPDMDAALDWARQAALACEGPVELRPLQGG